MRTRRSAVPLTWRWSFAEGFSSFDVPDQAMDTTDRKISAVHLVFLFFFASGTYVGRVCLECWKRTCGVCSMCRKPFMAHLWGNSCSNRIFFQYERQRKHSTTSRHPLLEHRRESASNVLWRERERDHGVRVSSSTKEDQDAGDF